MYIIIGQFTWENFLSESYSKNESILGCKILKRNTNMILRKENDTSDRQAAP